MKPLNLDNRPCSPISSNCVIWQGPDIPCIKICNGDTVSDIVYQLGTELCTIMEQLNVSNYDLSCFNLTACPPEDFQALIQLLIDKICEANGVTTDGTKAVNGCPDCVVSVAPCFVEGTNPPITAMQLVDYVQMIADRVCSIISEIAIINNQITNIDNRVTILENTPPPTFTLPSISTGCLSDVMSGATSATIDLVLNTLLNNGTEGYCQLIGATGLPTDLSQSVASQCIANTDDALAVPGQTMASAYGPYTVFGTWNSSPVTVADAINNLWISICDIRTYLTNFAINVEDTNSVNLNYTGGILSANIQDTGWVDLLGFNWFVGTPNYRPQCRRIGNVIHFRGALMVPLANGSGSVINYTYSGGDTYVGRTEVTPFTGAGGVTVDNQGAIYFNNNTSVIPTSVLPDTPSPILFDQNVYSSNYIVASRYILYNDSSGDQTTFSGILHTVCKIFIYSNKRMALQILKDNEFSAGGAVGNIFGTSALNSMVSRVNQNDRIQRWRTNIVDPGTWPDFHSSNIMNGSTTTIPTAPPSTISNPREINYSNDYRFPFTCDAGQPNNLGGFGWVQLEGLSAFISPCSSEIPTPTPC